MANPLKGFFEKEFKKPQTTQEQELISEEIGPELELVHIPQEPEALNYDSEMKRLFAIKNPATQMRYDIPMLDRNSPDYFFKYCDYMKIKERDEKTFNKILGWE